MHCLPVSVSYITTTGFCKKLTDGLRADLQSWFMTSLSSATPNKERYLCGTSSKAETALLSHLTRLDRQIFVFALIPPSMRASRMSAAMAA